MKRLLAIAAALLAVVTARPANDDLDKQLEQLRRTVPFRAYKEKYPNGQVRETGRKRSLGFVCGREWIEHDGKLEGWYENGVKECEIPFKDGDNDGVALNWFPNGTKKFIVTWKKGKKDGEFTVFYDSEMVSAKGEFGAGELQRADFFDRTGKQVTRNEWLAISGNKSFWD